MRNGKVVRGAVASVKGTTVSLADGSDLSGDYLVLACGGGSVAMPNGMPDDATSSAAFKLKLKEKQTVIKEAQRILIVGGGPVGIELAGASRKNFQIYLLI